MIPLDMCGCLARRGFSSVQKYTNWDHDMAKDRDHPSMISIIAFICIFLYRLTGNSWFHILELFRIVQKCSNVHHDMVSCVFVPTTFYKPAVRINTTKHRLSCDLFTGKGRIGP